MDAADGLGLTAELDLYVVHEARRAARVISARAGREIYPVAVNITPSSLQSEGFAVSILATLEATGVEPRRMTFEIIERGAIRNWAALRQGARPNTVRLVMWTA